MQDKPQILVALHPFHNCTTEHKVTHVSGNDSDSNATTAAVTTAVVTQAVVTKAATANSACWHHNAMVGAVWSPVWA